MNNTNSTFNIILLGSNGTTGKCFVNQVIERNKRVPGSFKLTAITRNSEPLKEKYKDALDNGLNFVSANIFKGESLSEVFKNNQIVVSCLGFDGKTQQYVRSCNAIIEGMRLDSLYFY